MDPESMEATPSADNGNVSVETETTPAPSETQTTETTPAEKTETTTTVEPTEELFELPDGRKVDAATLTKEWKENFLPDYTKKSQALAEVNKTVNPAPLQEKPANPYADPNYIPSNYDELIEQGAQRALAKLEEIEKSKLAAQQALETAVETQLNEVKAVDPQVNETALFLHATKYGFRDLKLAHQNMKDMSEVIKKTQTTTAANIAKRNDPVSATPGATGGRPDPSAFSSSREYLGALKASGIK